MNNIKNYVIAKYCKDLSKLGKINNHKLLRKRIFNEIKDIYKIRSRMLHSRLISHDLLQPCILNGMRKKLKYIDGLPLSLINEIYRDKYNHRKMKWLIYRILSMNKNSLFKFVRVMDFVNEENDIPRNTRYVHDEKYGAFISYHDGLAEILYKEDSTIYPPPYKKIIKKNSKPPTSTKTFVKSTHF
jgi:hypothetical protein